MMRTLLSARTAMFAVIAAVMISIPLLVEPYTLGHFSGWLYLSVAVLGMNVLIGMTGQISIGHGALIGTSAYVATIVSSDVGLTFFTACVVAVVVTTLVGLVVALPALRLKGLYVALPTIGLAIVFPTWLQALSEWTGGTAGKALNPPEFAPTWSGLADESWTYYVCLLVTFIAFVVITNVRNSRTGRSLRAVRDHELVAETFGIRVERTKILAFTVSAVLAGVAGCMFAFQRQFVSPSDFMLTLAISLLTGMAIGGQFTVIGALIGGAFLEFVPLMLESIGFDPVYTPLLYGATLIIIMLWFHDGLAGLLTRLTNRVSRTSGRTPGTDSNVERVLQDQ